MSNDLIARLRCAQGPDRALDNEIANSFCGSPMPADTAGWPPHFTELVDHALMLVPDGWMWSVHGGAGSCKGCQLEREDDDTPSGEAVCDDAATSAIAVCIAALLVRVRADG